MVSIIQNLRGLILDSVEVKRLTGWPPSMIEDYLSIRENFFIVSEEIEDINNGVKKIYETSSTPYVVPVDASTVFIDTDIQEIDILLRPGVKGKELRLVMVGTSGNDANITPNGSELLFGENSPEVLHDSEAFLIDYSVVYGWY